jgi:hypothetical protein
MPTETGALMTSRRNDYVKDKAWNWLRAEGPIADYLELIPQGSDTFEVVVKDGWPAKIMSNRDDGAYCTKDLVLRHPEQKTWFKYIGRLDDTLTQTLGEKTNPVPIELAIVSRFSPNVMWNQGSCVARQLAPCAGMHRLWRRETSGRSLAPSLGRWGRTVKRQGGVHQDGLASHCRGERESPQSFQDLAGDGRGLALRDRNPCRQSSSTTKNIH